MSRPIGSLNVVTQQIVESFEDALLNGAGDLTPEIDDIVVLLRGKTGLSLTRCRILVRQRLDKVLAVMRTRPGPKGGWVGVKVTKHYVDTYKGQLIDHPTYPKEIDRCVAGRSRGTETVAVHFCVQRVDCIMFVAASIHGLESGEGANGATVEKMKVVAQNGQLSIAGLDAIVDTAVPKRPALNGVREVRKIAKTNP